MSKDVDNTEENDEVIVESKDEVMAGETLKESDLAFRLTKAEKKIKLLTIACSVVVALFFLLGALGVAFKAGDRHSGPDRRFSERGPGMMIDSRGPSGEGTGGRNDRPDLPSRGEDSASRIDSDD